MSIIQLKDKRFRLSDHPMEHKGLMLGRERDMASFTFEGSKEELETIEKSFASLGTGDLTVYYHGEDVSLAEDALEGVAQKQYKGYDIPGDVVKSTKLENETPGVYIHTLTITLGQRLSGE